MESAGVFAELLSSCVSGFDAGGSDASGSDTGGSDTGAAGRVSAGLLVAVDLALVLVPAFRLLPVAF
ncbi:MAG TPA: hypothetical protein DIW77_20780 [Chromatiaceae bacterium]|nr:hypothetical protein [Chromatiaceae bacterium]